MPAEIISPGPGGPIDASIIVPLYKSRAVVEDQIAKWAAPEAGLTVEIVYVDDACPDRSGDEIARLWGARADKDSWRVTLVRNPENRGFAGACNAGAHHALGGVLVFLNADTVVTEGWISPLAGPLRADEKIGLIGNLQLKEGGQFHGTIDGAGSEWSWPHRNFLHVGRHILRGKDLPGGPIRPGDLPADLDGLSERDMVTGCCVAIRAELFRRIGGFDVRYKVGYWEDSELSMSVKELGYKIYFQGASRIWHKLSHAGVGAHLHHRANQMRFQAKWISPGRFDRLIRPPRPAALRPHAGGIMLIRRTGAHGDVLLAAGVAAAIKQRNPRTIVHFATACGAVLKNNPYIGKLIRPEDANRMRQRYLGEIDLDLAYERRPEMPILQAFAEEAGVPVAGMKFHVHCEPSRLGLRSPYAVIHAGLTHWAGRHWTREGFDEIARRLRAKGLAVVCIGAGGDRGVTADVDARGRLTIHQVADVIRSSAYFFGIDSMPMHLAQVLRAKGSAVFGSIDPAFRIFAPNFRGIVAPGVSCLGCHHKALPPSTGLSSCPAGTLACMTQLDPDYVWQRVEGHLDER